MERDDLLVLVDEEGTEQQFELVDAFELSGAEYVVLVPYIEYESEEEHEHEHEQEQEQEQETDDQDDNDENDDNDDNDDNDEVVILRKEKSKKGEDTFTTIDDENELDAAFDEFNIRMEEEFERDNVE